MSLRLRTFKVPADVEVRLAERAASQGLNKADLARKYLDELLASGDDVAQLPDETNAPLVLRSYYLSAVQDAALGKASKATSQRGSHVSKGRIFRAALMRGLGAAPRTRGVVAKRSSRPTLTRISGEDLLAALQLVTDAFSSPKQFTLAQKILAELRASPEGETLPVLMARTRGERESVEEVLESLTHAGALQTRRERFLLTRERG